VLESSPGHDRQFGPLCRFVLVNFGDAVLFGSVAEIRVLAKRCKAWPSSN
jgi:hypothetical protein